MAYINGNEVMYGVVEVNGDDEGYEVKQNKVQEISSMSQTGDNDKYPSVTAARNYTDTRNRDLQDYVDDSLDELDESFQGRLNNTADGLSRAIGTLATNKENKANKVTEITADSTADQYPTVAAAKNYTDARARYHYEQNEQITPITLEIVDGKYINTDGNEVVYTASSPQAKHSEQFSVTAGETLIISTRYGYSAPMIVFYNSSGAFLSVEGVSSTVVTAANAEVTVPANAAFAVLNCLYGNNPDAPFEVGKREFITIENKVKQLSDEVSGISEFGGKTLYVDGDSIMFGYNYDGTGSAQGRSVGEYLSGKYNMTLTKAAVTGTTLAVRSGYTNSIYERINALDTSTQYDYIIFDGGINDNAQSVTVGDVSASFKPEEFAEDTTTVGALERICRKLILDFPNTKKLFVVTHEVTGANSLSRNSSYLSRMSKCIEVCEKWGIPYVDMTKTELKIMDPNGITQARYFHANDRIHPNEAGYTIYAKTVEKALKNNV